MSDLLISGFDEENDEDIFSNRASTFSNSQGRMIRMFAHIKRWPAAQPPDRITSAGPTSVGYLDHIKDRVDRTISITTNYGKALIIYSNGPTGTKWVPYQWLIKTTTPELLVDLIERFNATPEN